MRTGYNGHKNWSHWNVYLWLSNEEELYRLALQYIRETPTLDKAAELLLCELTAGFGDANGVAKTPDGARYTFTSVRAALRGIARD